ncbi:MAG TPA: HD-GYP domain-containing protein [Clostridiales bacterium]|nr:HD-GYP domain-containing protein [Clostridiales bacterium]
MEVIRIRIGQVQEGMTIANDIFNLNKLLIVAKGQTLNRSMINKLKEYNIYELYVFKTQQTFDLKKDSYLDFLRDTEDFRIFNNTYIETLDTLKPAFLHIVEQEKIDPVAMVDAVNSILDSSKSGAHMMEMLHGIRDYDDITYAHSMNVAIICNIFATWIGLKEEDRHVLILCGLLHDIGKMLVPSEITLKNGKLTEEEYDVMKTHTTRGFHILKDQELDDRIKLSALLHHERRDGTGYPNGYLEHNIPDFCKIVAIADVYDAMTSDRIYRKAICPFDVVKEFERDGFAKYDTSYLMIFLERIVYSYLNNIVLLSDGRQAEVILINKLSLDKPVVRINDEFIDLSKRKDLNIISIV